MNRRQIVADIRPNVCIRFLGKC